MKLSLNTYSEGNEWPLERVIEIAKNNGYHGIEFRVQADQQHGIEPAATPDERLAARTKIEQAGLATSCLSTSVQFASNDAAEREVQLETCKRIIELAHDLDCRFLKVGANRPPEGVSDEEFITYVGRSLKQAGEYAARHGVRVLLEMHTPFWSWPNRALAVLEVSGREGTGLIFNCEPEDIVDGSMAAVWELVKADVPHIHIHDLLNRKIVYPYEEFFGLLRRDGYTGYVSVEISAYSLGEGVDGATAFGEIAERFRKLTA